MQQGEQVTVKGVLKDSGVAVRTIMKDGCLRLFVPFALLLNLLSGGATSLALPFCMEKGFTVEMYGYLMSAYTVAYLVCTLLLGAVKFKPKTRFMIMAVGFSLSEVFLCIGYLVNDYLLLCVMICLGAFMNCAGNTIFNASLMLALPEENRGAILGFIQSASTGGMALSAVLYGMLGEVMPLYLAFAAGSVISLAPMVYLCFHPRTKSFVLEN